MTVAKHTRLDCGIELAVHELPQRQAVSAQIRVLVGFAHEPPEALGLNHVVEQTLSKGTVCRSGRQLSDAFDAIGVRWSSWAGRESTGYQFTSLPEFADQAWSLHAEFLREPTFPDDAVRVTVDNLLQEIDTLDDDPGDLSAKLFNRQVYGPILGRHVLGEKDTLQALSAGDVRAHWQRYYHGGRMQIAVAGPVQMGRVAEQLEICFAGCGAAAPAGREPFAYHFEPQTCHHHKALEQEHIGICYPGAGLQDPRQYTQRVVCTVLSGGMSGRLFTELREKQGLVYWVTAHTEHPRGIGIVYLGASTTPERCARTYQTLLREIDRLAEDLEADELRRAINGLVSRAETRGDITRSRCSELSEDLFHYGHPVPLEDKIARTRQVTIADVKAYLHDFPRDQLSVLTLGPAELGGLAADGDRALKPMSHEGV